MRTSNLTCVCVKSSSLLRFFFPQFCDCYIFIIFLWLGNLIAEALKKTTLFKSSTHESKPKKAPKKAAPRKRNVSDSDEDMFAVSKKKVS